MHAYLRADAMTTAYRAPEPVSVTLRRGNPASVPLLLPALTGLVNAALSCEFLPDGFEVTLPCGWIQVR